MDITLTADQLTKLLEAAAEVALMRAGVAGPTYVSRSALEKKYGHAWVAKRLADGKIAGTRRGAAKNSTIKFEAASVRAVWEAERVATVNL